MARSKLIIAALVACSAGAVMAAALPPRECSSIAFSNSGNVVFGANLDHVSVSDGLVFINPRGVEKTGLNPSTTGQRARWRSRHASVTFNLVGYQFAWAGMNDQGLALSTMSLYDTEYPPADQRPPLDSGEWMQFILDTCATVDDVVATDAMVRIYTVDHYLVADRWGNCAAVEFLGGEMAVHTGDDMPATVLTNSTYSQSLATWLRYRDSGNYAWMGSSLHRFCLAADRVASFLPADGESAIAYAFDTLELIRGENFSIHTSQWSLVFDTGALRAYFRTFDHPEMRYVDLESFDLRCVHPVQMLDIQEPLSGDVSADFFDFSYDLAFQHMQRFMNDWGISISTQTLHQILRHFASFPCLLQLPRRPSGRIAPTYPKVPKLADVTALQDTEERLSKQD